MKSIQRLAPLFLASLALSSAAYASDAPTNLTAAEKKAVALSKQWAAGKRVPTPPALADDGSIRFVYGTQQHTVVCAIFEVCNISLEPGETVLNINAGDTVRWDIKPSVSGTGPTTRIHVVVKPLDAGISTSLNIYTDRRVYHIRLKSTKNDYMANVSFVYPEDMREQFAKLSAQHQQKAQREVLPGTNDSILDLSFNYEVDGSARWKPTRVYNNGRQTFIQMPKTLGQEDAPVLLVVNSNGDEVIVNYQAIGDKYLVDSVFRKAVLLSGVGRSQEKVTITRLGD